MFLKYKTKTRIVVRNGTIFIEEGYDLVETPTSLILYTPIGKIIDYLPHKPKDLLKGVICQIPMCCILYYIKYNRTQNWIKYSAPQFNYLDERHYIRCPKCLLEESLKSD